VNVLALYYLYVSEPTSSFALEYDEMVQSTGRLQSSAHWRSQKRGAG
jgi:hypothetical protein